VETELASLTSRRLSARNLVRYSEAALNEYPNAKLSSNNTVLAHQALSACLPTNANFDTSPSLHSICKGPRPPR